MSKKLSFFVPVPLPEEGRKRGWALINLSVSGIELSKNSAVKLWLHVKLPDGTLTKYFISLGVVRNSIMQIIKWKGMIQSAQLEFYPAVRLKNCAIKLMSKRRAFFWLMLLHARLWMSHPLALWRFALPFFKQLGRKRPIKLLENFKTDLLRSSPFYRDDYSVWVDNYDPCDLPEQLKAKTGSFVYQPIISIILPVFNTPEKYLRKAIDSVINQAYPYWELCIADDKSSKSSVRAILEEYRQKDSRIRVKYREVNGHISAASNSAFEISTGEYVTFLDHDDELSPSALFFVVEALQAHPAIDVLYSDEDKITPEGVRFSPYFKPDWNLTLLYSHNFVNHLLVYRRAAVKSAGGFRLGFEGSQDYDLLLRIAERLPSEKIIHIPRVLYHWRALATSTASDSHAKEYALLAAKRALEEHFLRMQIPATIHEAPNGWHRIRYQIPAPNPLVTLIICTRDRGDLLRGALDGLLEKTTYRSYEVLVVDNQSSDPQTLHYLNFLTSHPNVKVLRYDAPFNFSAMNNWAASQGAGSLLGFLNNDVTIITPEWLTEMVSYFSEPMTGAVGGKLYYPNDLIQHAGIVLGIGGVAGHPHKGLPRRSAGYAGRASIVQEVSAVTGACLITRSSIFKELGGFDSENLPIAFNDVDYCLKLQEKGYRVIFTPHAELYHFESASRGSDETAKNRIRYDRERKEMFNRWKERLGSDPYYNPNLTLADESLGLAMPPRV